MDKDVVWAFLSTQGLDFGMKVLGAIVAWFVGRWLIGMLKRLVHAALRRGRSIDETLATYLTAFVAVALNVLLERLRGALAKVPNVAQTPAPEVEILQFTPEGPLLAVRPYTHTNHYWQVFFDTHKAIVDSFTVAGYPVPEVRTAQRSIQPAASNAANPGSA